MPDLVEVITDNEIIETVVDMVVNETDNNYTLVDSGDQSTVVIEVPSIQILATSETEIISITEESINIISEGIQGPPGIAGNTITLIAGEDISAMRVVYLATDSKVYKASNLTTTTRISLVGVAETAAIAGDTTIILISGLLVNSGWSWSMVGDLSVYLADDGVITRTAPTTGYVIKLGYITSPTSIIIDKNPSITLA